MNQRLNRLQDAGCDIPGALDRMLDDEIFLLECIEQVLADENFDLLPRAIAAGELSVAFDAAHTLKGICGNTGLTPLYEQLFPLVEELRAGRMTALTGQLTALADMRETLCAIGKAE